MAAFFYTAAMQTEKLRLNDLTTNLPAKMGTVMVVLAAAAAEMVVVRSGRRIWMGRQSQLLRRNDATDLQPNGRQRPIVIPAAATADHPAAMLDNLGVTKAATKTNVGPCQQGNNTGGYNDRGDNGPHSSLANGEDNNATMVHYQGNTTAAGR
jgi:hypothetical protein